LDHCGVAWQRIADAKHHLLARRWKRVYGRLVADRLRFRQGVRAEAEFAREAANRFFIVPFLNERGVPQAIGDRLVSCAYECAGKLVPLGDFAGRDLFVAPPDFAWTMIHTHEDHALGGPYFSRAEWLVPPTRRRGW
jgi:hypothetical protein